MERIEVLILEEQRERKLAQKFYEMAENKTDKRKKACYEACSQKHWNRANEICLQIMAECEKEPGSLDESNSFE